MSTLMKTNFVDKFLGSDRHNDSRTPLERGCVKHSNYRKSLQRGSARHNNSRTTLERGLIIAYVMSLLAAVATATSNQIAPSSLPLFFIPEACDRVHLQGFNRALLVPQHYTSSPSSSASADLMDCTLTLTVHGPYRLRFTFEHIDLSPPTPGGVCQDHVQLFNGGDSASIRNKLLLTEPICGSTPPSSSFTSNTTTVSLVFTSTAELRRRHRDSSLATEVSGATSLGGFRIRFERISLADIETEEADRLGLAVEGTRRTGLGPQGARSLGEQGNSDEIVSSYTDSRVTVHLGLAVLLVACVTVILSRTLVLRSRQQQQQEKQQQQPQQQQLLL